MTDLNAMFETGSYRVTIHPRLRADWPGMGYGSSAQLHAPSDMSKQTCLVHVSILQQERVRRVRVIMIEQRGTWPSEL